MHTQVMHSSELTDWYMRRKRERKNIISNIELDFIVVFKQNTRISGQKLELAVARIVQHSILNAIKRNL